MTVLTGCGEPDIEDVEWHRRRGDTSWDMTLHKDGTAEGREKYFSQSTISGYTRTSTEETNWKGEWERKGDKIVVVQKESQMESERGPTLDQYVNRRWDDTSPYGERDSAYSKEQIQRTYQVNWWGDELTNPEDQDEVYHYPGETLREKLVFGAPFALVMGVIFIPVFLLLLSTVYHKFFKREAKS
ncbi:MAG: hypothetical protein KDA84_03890 [Planctomycetaceae bacterium]|nr:hypothetical protein [Planctomycetaceae bacterium]